MPKAMATVRYQKQAGMTRIIGALAGVACLTLTAGCASQGSSSVPVGAGSGSGGSSQPSAAAVTLKDDANGKTVHVPVGSHVTLILSSNYWTVAGSSASAVLRQDGGSTVLPRPSSCSNVPGMGCNPIRTEFTAVAPGTAAITADRQVCGEAQNCAPSMRHFVVTVVVDQG